MDKAPALAAEVGGERGEGREKGLAEALPGTPPDWISETGEH